MAAIIQIFLRGSERNVIAVFTEPLRKPCAGRPELQLHFVGNATGWKYVLFQIKLTISR